MGMASVEVLFGNPFKREEGRVALIHGQYMVCGGEYSTLAQEGAREKVGSASVPAVISTTEEQAHRKRYAGSKHLRFDFRMHTMRAIQEKKYDKSTLPPKQGMNCCASESRWSATGMILARPS